MYSDLNVSIPTELVNEYEINGTMVNPVNPSMGILILSKNFVPRSKEIIVRLYRIQKNRNNSYSINYELEAFSFQSYNQAKSFISNFPQMTAAELLLFLNPEPQ